MVSLSLMDPYTPAARHKLKLFVAASEQLRLIYLLVFC